MSEATDVVDRQVAAYRDRDLERFPGCYAAGVKVRDFDGNVLMDGLEAMRGQYGAMFRDSPAPGRERQAHDEKQDASRHQLGKPNLGGAAGPASAPGSAFLGRPARRTPGHTRRAHRSRRAHRREAGVSRTAVFLAFHCPARDRRV